MSQIRPGRWVPRWRESDAFDERERRVMEYAEAMSVTPPQVTDAMAEALRADLGDSAFVELTMTWPWRTSGRGSTARSA